MRLYGRVLDEAAERSWQTLAVPALGTGAAGLEARESAAALRSALRERRLDVPSLRSLLVATNPAFPNTFDRVTATLTRPEAKTATPIELLRAGEDDAVEGARQQLLALWTAAVQDPDPATAEQLFAAVLVALDNHLSPRDDPRTSRVVTGGQQSLPKLIESIEQKYRGRGDEAPAPVLSALQAGTIARNRVVHQRVTGTIRRNLRRTLLKAAEDLTFELFGAPMADANTASAAQVALDPLHAMHQFLLASLRNCSRLTAT